MNETVFVGLISAASGLVGVIVGAVLPWFRDGWDNKRKARYLAIRIVCILDEFLETCTSVVGDDGLCYGRRNADGYLQAQVALPNGLQFPADVDWKSIDHGLMYRILALPSRIEADNRVIAAVGDDSFPPDFDEVFDERQYRYACLGLDTADLVQTLRRTYGIPPREYGRWDPAQTLRDKKAKIDRTREELRLGDTGLRHHCT